MSAAMKSVFDVARSHINLHLSRDVNALRRVLRDWQHHTERLELQEKATHPAELCITVHTPRKETTSIPSRGFSLYHRGSPTGNAVLTYTKSVPMRLWTALLPWEVQRGLSLSELRLPESLSNPGKGAPPEKGLNNERNEEDTLGVVTTPPGIPSSMLCASRAAPETVAPGMLFAMDSDASAESLCFWSGAILQPIDVAFIAPIEPAATDSPSFQELRRQQWQRTASRSGYDTSRFFPDGELDSPTVTFAMQSYTHLDPFPRFSNCGKSGAEKGKYQAQPTGVGQEGSRLRYVLETTRHLLRDNIASALQEYRQLHCSAAGPALTVDANEKGKKENEAVEITVTIKLSGELKDELREKARLYTNYVVPLEEHISYHIRRQCSASVRPAGKIDHVDRDAVGREKDVTADNHLVVCDSETTSGVRIIPSRINRIGADRRLLLRSPSLADEVEGSPMSLAPSVVGRHEAPALQRAQREENQITSAGAIARYPNTTAYMPTSSPIDYELFDLCLRLGLCHGDVIYYYYGRILRVWQKELLRLRAFKTTREKTVDDSDLIADADVRRMLLLVRDPSLQVPAELVECVETVARSRGVDGSS